MDKPSTAAAAGKKAKVLNPLWTMDAVLYSVRPVSLLFYIFLYIGGQKYFTVLFLPFYPVK